MKLSPTFNLGLLMVAAILTACSYGQATARDRDASVASDAANYALSFVGTRYRYGGNHPSKGFDCSGLVQYSYSKAGYRVPRTTRAQRRTTRAVSHNRLKKGDLLFFNQAGKRSGHVGIYVGKNQFVHAPSSGKTVRVDSLNNRYWRRHLNSARRFHDI